MHSVSISFGVEGLRPDDLDGFFVGWPDPPSLDDQLGILAAADEVVVARTDDGTVIGFATAITDRRFAAYVPLVEVLPEHQGRRVGSQLVEALLDRLRTCYMIDLVCDDDVVPFYERLGGTRLAAMAWRNYDRLHTTT
ncbi:MAG: GNAT family N-acetyltransferase [Acidimicrobiales bacterium]